MRDLRQSRPPLRPQPVSRRRYRPEELPVRTPDARRLHGYPTAFGILWRDLAIPDRLMLCEANLREVVLHERAVSENALA